MALRGRRSQVGRWESEQWNGDVGLDRDPIKVYSGERAAYSGGGSRFRPESSRHGSGQEFAVGN